MAKQVYEIKKAIKLVGTLCKDEEGKYIVEVDNGKNYQTYELNEVLEQMVDSEISLSSDIY